MLTLSADILLYHGSYTAVPDIDLSKCNSGLDFGCGFYVTTSYDQAVSFVPNSVKRNIRTGNLPADFDVNNGQVSVYRFHPDPMLLIETFSEANLDWLHFVAATGTVICLRISTTNWKPMILSEERLQTIIPLVCLMAM